VQYNMEVPTALNITDICAMMTNASDAYTGLLAVNAWFVLQQPEPCVDASYASAIAQYKNTTVAGGSAVNRQWLYQTCTGAWAVLCRCRHHRADEEAGDAEFGYFQTTTGSADSQPFGTLSPLAFQVQECQDIFNLCAAVWVCVCALADSAAQARRKPQYRLEQHAVRLGPARRASAHSLSPGWACWRTSPSSRPR
jgi:hypothetical protein